MALNPILTGWQPKLGRSGVILARYFEGPGDEEGVILSRLRRFSRERQWPYIRHWFLGMFEDPANEIPRAEGEYHYVWGGPYNALEELESEFTDFDFDRLQDFAQRLEDRGGVVDWAPGPAHPDQRQAAEDYARELEERQAREAPSLDELLATLQAGAATHFGDEGERRERAATLRRLDALDAKLDQLLEARTGPGMGHNMPPEAMDATAAEAAAIEPEDLAEAKENTAAIREELQKAEPDAQVVAEKSSWLKQFLEKVAVDVPVTLVKGVVTVAVIGVGKAWLGHRPELTELGAAYVDQAITWISHVIVMPF